MREHKLETLIVTKEAFKWLQNEDRKVGGCRLLTDEWFEKQWSKRVFRNGGANPKTHPISDDEIRIDRWSTRFSIERIKKMLTENGFEYRQDGHTEQVLS